MKISIVLCARMRYTLHLLEWNQIPYTKKFDSYVPLRDNFVVECFIDTYVVMSHQCVFR